MRVVRPTVKALKMLPKELFPSEVRARLADRDPSLLDGLYDLEHPVLQAAREQVFEGHRCQPHKAATKAAGSKVFEVEEAATGWRAAVVMDDRGDPWLVHAAEHDAFHRSVADLLAKVNRSHYLPMPFEYTARSREDYARAVAGWERDLAAHLLRAIDEAGADPLATHAVPAYPDPRRFEREPGPLPEAKDFVLRVESEHDPVASGLDPRDAHTSHDLVDLEIALRGATHRSVRESVTTVVHHLFGTGADYLPNSSGVRLSLSLTKADLVIIRDRVAQLAQGGGALDEAPHGVTLAPPTHQHYIRESMMADSLITARPVRAVCDHWFIVSRDGTSAAEVGLPICPECEERRPIAQQVLDLFRADATRQAGRQ